MKIVIPVKLDEGNLTSSLQEEYPQYDPARGGGFPLLDPFSAVGLAVDGEKSYVLYSVGTDISKIAIHEGGAKTGEIILPQRYKDICVTGDSIYAITGSGGLNSVRQINLTTLAASDYTASGQFGFQPESITTKSGEFYSYSASGHLVKIELSINTINIIESTPINTEFYFSKIKDAGGSDWAVLQDEFISIHGANLAELYRFPIKSKRVSREGGLDYISNSFALLDDLERRVDMVSDSGQPLAEYLSGEQVTLGEDIYKAVVNTTDKPTDGEIKEPKTWVRMGKSNRWRGFRDGEDSISNAESPVEFTISSNEKVDTISILAASSELVTLTVKSGGSVIHQDEIIINDEMQDLIDESHNIFYLGKKNIIFENIPDGDEYSVSLLGQGDVSFGQVVAGQSIELGGVLVGTQIGFENLSVRGRDEFGNATLRPLRTIDKVDYECFVDSVRASFVRSVIKLAADTPSLYIGSDEFEGVNIFGIPDEPRLNFTTKNIVNMSITVRGI